MTRLRCGKYLLVAAVLVNAGAQTRVDLRTQGKSVDFSAVPTKPFRTGATLPNTCSVGETFFKTSAPAGKNFYGCTAPNVWTVQSPPDLPAGQAGQVLSNDGAGPAWTGVAGDVTGAPGAIKVQGLQGRTVSPATPSDGNALKWNGGTNQWEPAPANSTLGGDVTGTAGSTVVKGLEGRAVSAMAPSDGQALKWNAGSNQWEPGLPGITMGGDVSGDAGSTVVKALQGNSVSTTTPADGQGLRWNGTARQWEPGSPNTTLAGDASGAAGSTVVKGLQGRGVSANAPSGGQALTWNSGSSQWEPGTPSTTVGGDASGPASSMVVTGLRGRPVSNNSAVEGQALKWNGALNQWEPGQPSVALSGDASGAAVNTVVKGLQGRAVSASAPADGQALKWNGATSQWEPSTVESSASGDVSGLLSSTVVQRLQGRSVSSTLPADGQALTWNGALKQWQPGNVASTLAGDASGPSGATLVKGLQGRAVASTAPTDGQTLKWNGAASQWEPGTAGATLAGDANGPSGSNLVTALQGHAVSSTAPADGQALKWNAASSRWEAGTLAGDAGGPFGATVVKGLQGRTVSAVAPTDGQSLRWNASSNQWEPVTPAVSLSGDATGSAASTVVKGLQGRAVSAAPPSDGQTLRWNAGLGEWEPGGSAVNYSAEFKSQTDMVIPGSAHRYRTQNLLVQCYDAESRMVMPSSVSVDSETYNITIRFREAQSGKCIVGGGGSGSSSVVGGESTVASVFGRVGIISARPGDYNFSQISGAVTNAQLGTGIDAGKIGGGTVSNATFGHLANARSDLQAQIDSKAAAEHSHSLAGDVIGDLSAAVVTKIQGHAVAATAATDGQALTWNTQTGQWEPHNIAGGSGGLSTLGATRTSETTLAIGANCSADTPCNVRFGTTVWSIQKPATATISAGDGTAYIYVDRTGTVVVGHNLSVTCSAGCQAQSGITGFPTDVIPIATWEATGGTWDYAGSDWRAWLSTKVLSAGEGVMIVDAGGTSTVAVDTTVIPTYLKGSATLDFPSIANGSCATDVTIPVPGATLGDAVAAAWPSTLLRGLLGTMFVSGTDTVSVRLCNFSGSTVEPAPATFSATIIRSY